MIAQKNHTLELLKLFASYMVVFIHVPFYGAPGSAVDALARFAVPFFFVVSGYYSYRIPCDKIKKRLKNVFSLTLLAVVCSTAFEMAVQLKYNPDGLTAFLQKYTEFSTYVDLLAFNVPVSSGHLWYLLAALYVYVAFYFVTKYNVKETVVFIVSFALLLLHVVLGEGLSVFGIVLPIRYLRNFALMGIPFFGLGLFVKKYERQFHRVPNGMVCLCAAVGVLATLLSRFLFGANELHVGSLLVLAAMVCLFIKGADAKPSSFLMALDGCSTYIYIFHIIISTSICIVYGMMGMDIYASVPLHNVHPLIVCVASTAFAYGYIQFKKRFEKTRNQT